MGNIVASEALRINSEKPSPSPLVARYVASQAASVAHAYDATVKLVNWRLITQTPEVYAAYPPTGGPYFAEINQSAKFVLHFYNSEDHALSAWGLNQALKPHNSFDYEFVGLRFKKKCWTYDPIGFGFYILDFPQHKYMIYSYAAEARSLGLGAEGETGGPINKDKSLDLKTLTPAFSGGASDHSGQYLDVLSRRHQYWESILDRMGL